VIDQPKCFVIPNTEETVTRMVEALAAYWMAEGIAGELDQLEREETARAMRAVLQSFGQDPAMNVDSHDDVEVLTRFGRFNQLGQDHPSVGQPCALCAVALEAGDVPSLVNPAPAGSRDAEKAAEGRAHTVEARIAHQSCAYSGARVVSS